MRCLKVGDGLKMSTEKNHLKENKDKKIPV